MLAPSTLGPLQTFRADLYACFHRRRDALFELTYAAFTAGLLPSLTHLGLETPHRRGWGSLYAALAKGRIDVAALRSLLRFARRLVSDCRLPWERPLSADRLAPGRVRQTLSTLLSSLGSPADPPKPCGHWPGRRKDSSMYVGE